MNIKKITAFAAAFVLSLGVLAAVPEEAEDYDGAVVVASADDEDFYEPENEPEADENGFVIKTDDNGQKFVYEYRGEGGDIRIPNGVSYIGSYAFYDAKMKEGTRIIFPRSCTRVGAHAFDFCYELKSVVFEGDVKIEDGAFARCYNLKSVTVKGSIIDYIGYCSFMSCTSLKKFDVLQCKNKFTIDKGAFFNCHSLSSMKIGNKCEEIGPVAFYNCISLQSINIPSSCKKILSGAFVNCFKLKQLTIPAKTELGKICFGYYILDDKIYKNKEYDPSCYNSSFKYLSVNDKAQKAKDNLYMIMYNDVIVEKSNYFKADGKKHGYFLLHYGEFEDKWGYPEDCEKINYYYESKKPKWIQVTPVSPALIVTKGSPAEKYAKENGIKYKYAK